MAERAEQGLMEEIEPYERKTYIETGQGTRFSDLSVLLGGHNIILGAKTIIAPESVFRGDLAKVKLGKNCVVGRKCVIRPAPKRSQGRFNFFPVQIGSHTFIADECVVEGKRSIVSDCCRIDDGTVIPPDSVLAPFTRWRGEPGKQVGDLSDGFEHMMVQATRTYYERFITMAR